MINWIDYGKSWRDFSSEEFCRPGVLIKMDCNMPIRTYLIGDINTNGGVCDDCMAFSRSDIVTAYAEIMVDLEVTL